MNRSQGSAIAESLWHRAVLEESGNLNEARWYFRKASRLAPEVCMGFMPMRA